MRVGGVATVIAASVVLAVSASAAQASSPPARYYLALGDSLSVGFQPNAKGVGRETRQGYDQILYARAHRRLKNLQLVELGCPGDSTTSMLTGKGNEKNARAFHCDRQGGSQLAAAVRFLKAHHRRGEVPLITIDIGANDVDGCASEPSAGKIFACVSKGETSIKKNTPKILGALRRAAPAGTRFAAMNLYDPILAYALSSDSGKRQLAQISLALVRQVNNYIDSASRHAHFKLADVAGAFKTYDQTPVSYHGGQVATDVVEICKLTWMCAPSPVGPNIHANPTGYKTIAGAFEKVLGRL